VARGTAAGAAAYLTKPFDPVQLLDLVEELATGD
jgi:CheY-like chemotaxis protein